MNARISRGSMLSLLTGTALTLGGCGGGGGGTRSGPVVDPATDYFRATDVEIKPDVIALPGDGSVVFTDVTEIALTMTGAPAPPIGSVIVSEAKPGILRRVVSVTPLGGGHRIETRSAALTDVFAQATIAFKRTLFSDDAETIQIHQPGVQIGSTRSQTRASQELNIPVIVPRTFIGETSSAGSAGIELSANGTLRLHLECEIRITLRNGVERFSLIGGLDWLGEHSFKLVGQARFGRRENRLGTWIGNIIPLGFVGPVPIFILPVMHILNVFDGLTLGGGLEATGNGTAGLEAGMIYAQNPPGSDFTLNNITPIFNGTNSGVFNAPNFYASMSVGVTPIQLVVETSLDALVGPAFKMDIPTIGLELRTDLLPTNTVKLKADANLRAKISSNAGFLGSALPAFELSESALRFPLLNKEFRPGTGGATVQ